MTEPLSLPGMEPPAPVAEPAKAPLVTVTQRSGLPSFWVTSIAKILVGDQPCLRESWVKGRYQIKDKHTSKMDDWKVRHTALLTKERERLEADGWRLGVERFMRLTGQFAELSGKPDLICQKTDCRPKIVDTKGGEPRDSDIAQVKIYMIAIPMFWQAPGMLFDGEVVYADHRVFIPAADTEAIRSKLFQLLRQLGTMDMPDPTPSDGNCRWCRVPPEFCDQRFPSTTPSTEVFDF